MMKRCDQPIPLEDLIAYHLAELPSERESDVEEHYMGCAECASRLESVVALGAGIRAVVREGQLSAFVTARLLDRGHAGGLRIRTYELHSGGAVECTAAPTDDFVVARLRVDANEAESVDVDVRWTDLETGHPSQEFMGDVVFDRTTSEVLMLFPGDRVRSFPKSQWNIELIVHEPGQTERRSGPYTMNHTPWEQLPNPA